MRIHACLTALFLLAWCGGAAAQMDREEQKKFDAFKKQTLRKEKGGTWKKIRWQKDMDAALAAAQKSGKPILVVLLVGHRAQKGAAEC